MKEYLFLFRGGKTPIHPDKEQIQQWVKWISDLQRRRLLINAQPLNETGKRLTGSGNIIHDGPFRHNDEQVEGFLLCRADSYEMAVQIGRDCPVLLYEEGNIEIREVQEIKL